MAQFNFERNLVHQTRAIQATVGVFENLGLQETPGHQHHYSNPVFQSIGYYSYVKNITTIQQENNITESPNKDSKVIDIMMETGTGKTYTYTKTIFELNKKYGIFKFVVVVPTLPIKAGTINFLNSDSARAHFKEQYNKTIQLHIVESKKGQKSKKSYMPRAVNSFVKSTLSEKNKIQVLIINAGMINSKTMQEKFDRTLRDKYTSAFEAISGTNSFIIVDEPHKFAKENTTWKNINKMNPQHIIRYGATFPEKEIKQKNIYGKIEKITIKDYHNLVYTLTAVDSFNNNLVKGIVGHVTEFESGKNSIVRFVSSDGTQANLELTDNGQKTTFNIAKKESMEKIHQAMKDLVVEKINKTTLLLSNGLSLKRGDKINPYSYTQTLQEQMIARTIREHFKLELEYMTQSVKIKPLTLFFIDNIDEYRGKNGYIKTTIENYIRLEVEQLLPTVDNEFYRNYLQETLKNISATHGGYFSQDNSDKDEKIEQEVNEILHDKQAILDINNPRRFILSKRTLREGRDNPNIFQICKLRSSGSEISKLQEVGRGLRLPVNQYGNRVKDTQFFLNYFVDFTENDFVEKLVSEINKKSGAISREDNKDYLDKNTIQKICDRYRISKNDLLQELDDNNIITRSNDFKEGGFEYIKLHYGLIFDGIDSNKIRKKTDTIKKVTIRTEQYRELKDLWEQLNQKVLLEYKIKYEQDFKELFLHFLDKSFQFEEQGLQEKKKTIVMEENQAFFLEESSVKDNRTFSLSTMNYDNFLKDLSKALHINLKTIHDCFLESKIKINNYLNHSTIRLLQQNFDNYLMYNALSQYTIAYQKINSSIHPTKLTTAQGKVAKEIHASDIGILHSDERVASSYMFDTLFYDSELEKENIMTNIDEVIVFTKIPKNSIKIPVAGGKSYSPDFAYVLKHNNGTKRLHFVIETKNTNEESLRNEEKQKIKHAEKFFGDTITIQFKKQFSNKTITNLIQEIYTQE